MPPIIPIRVACKGDYFYYGLNCKGPRKRVAGKHFFVLKEWNTEEASDVTNKINNGMSLKELAFQCLDSRDSKIIQYLNEHTNVEHVFVFEVFKKSKPVLIWDGSVQYVSNYINELEYSLVSVNRKDENIADFYAKAEALHFRVDSFLFDEKMGDLMLEQCEDEAMIENMKIYLDVIFYGSVVDYGVECFEQENKYLRDHILLPYSLQMLLDKCKNANRKCENIVNTMLIRL